MRASLTSQPRIGRFAPSPTGPLHFGSLVAAVASYLEARGGQWLLRIEDVDRPRAVAGMAALQQEMLQAYGFEWEGAVIQQSDRAALYDAALTKLIAANLAYPCTCSRSALAAYPDSRIGVDGARVYPGICQHWQHGDPIPEGAAWRFRVGGVNAPDWVFVDQVQGTFSQQLARDVGDFVLRRADGCTTYQLAVVVDDLAQGVTQVVRGADLLDSTLRQMALITALGGQVPDYAHVPVAVNTAGEKLSKQTLAPTLSVASEAERVGALWSVLSFLGQAPPDALLRASQAELWAWAKTHWLLDRVPKQRSMMVPTLRAL